MRSLSSLRRSARGAIGAWGVWGSRIGVYELAHKGSGIRGLEFRSCWGSGACRVGVVRAQSQTLVLSKA